MKKYFIVELGTEELPPKALKTLIESFKQGVMEGLKSAGLSHGSVKAYSTPRRLALGIEDLALQGEGQTIEKRGPIKALALNADGEASSAALGFAKTCGVKFSALTWVKTDKGEYLAYQGAQAGAEASVVLPGIIQKALESLPIQKLMRWGDFPFEFVRPVRSLLMLHGTDIVPAELFGQKSNRLSFGHPVHHPKSLSLDSAETYVEALQKAYVLVDREERAKQIHHSMEAIAKKEQARLVFDADLLEEVTAIVEWPVPLLCQFEPAFLKVPKEALISAMQGHQKCFALETQAGELLPKFITIANIESEDPARVISGNERVMRARLSDAAFFYDKDLKLSLDSFLPRLESVTFQVKLGSLADKVRRVKKLLQKMKAGTFTLRAAELSKADLMSEMVYEFPELQGIMGEYYAKAGGEAVQVSKALFEQYLPRFSGDQLPQTQEGKYLALADRLDTLVGIFGIGLKPTGSKDPFALRRAMIAVIRLLTEGDLNFDLWALCVDAKAGYHGLSEGTVEELKIFALDRLKVFWIEEKAYDPVWVGALISSLLYSKEAILRELESRLQTIIAFSKTAEGEKFLLALKRVSHVIKKQPLSAISAGIDPKQFQKPVEQELFQLQESLHITLGQLEKAKNNEAYLRELSRFTPLLNRFFDEVRVMDEDLLIQCNRLSLLAVIYRMAGVLGLQ